MAPDPRVSTKRILVEIIRSWPQCLHPDSACKLYQILELATSDLYDLGSVRLGSDPSCRKRGEPYVGNLRSTRFAARRAMQMGNAARVRLITGLARRTAIPEHSDTYNAHLNSAYPGHPSR